MNFHLLYFFQALSSVFALNSIKNFAQRDKSASDWTEALDDFKTLVRAITFGEDLPSHHSNPLQIMFHSDYTDSRKARYESPGDRFGKKENGGYKKNRLLNTSKKTKKRKALKTKNKKIKFPKKSFIGPAEIREQLNIDDLAFFHFLMQLEEPKSRVSVQSHKNKKNLSLLITAENRYNEIKKNIEKASSKMTSKRSSRINILTKESKKSGKSFSKAFLTKSSDDQIKNIKKSKKNVSKTKKWFERIDMKGAKNTLTLSVAFGIIVTALFCVVVQLFKLFSNFKTSGSSSAFEQINRRSTYGYDKIALDIEDDEENNHSN